MPKTRRQERESPHTVCKKKKNKYRIGYKNAEDKTTRTRIAAYRMPKKRKINIE
jgi:hypothetical protein